MTRLPAKFVDLVPLVPGQNASVFRATNSFLNRPAFLKIYPIPEGDPHSALREPQLLQSLCHPNLATIHSADALRDNRLLLEMELIDGGSLKELIDSATSQGNWPSIHEVLDYTSDLARGLSEMHNARLVHRDVKPANVMLRNGTGRKQAVVTDLGLASTLDDSGRSFASRHSRLYRPPEVWERRGYSRASDVYQTGIVLFQMLGGKMPYSMGNLDDDDLSHIICTHALLDLSDIGPHVDPSLRRILTQCICSERSRLTRMTDLINAIAACKRDHFDWRYTLAPDGFILTREANGRRYEVEVSSDGNSHSVSGKKRIGGGQLRRIFPDETIVHGSLGRSQAFRSLLRKT
ncbi:MAG: serine/threonine protein kinase [Nitrospira sp.]|nr:serine/threonine protein kinase [Nitrospira sp.]